MKSLNFSITLIVIVLLSFSCTPIYKCGQPKPTKKLFIPKIFQVVINERDSLCTNLAARENEVSGLKADTTLLHSTLASRDKEISGLKQDTVMQNNKFIKLEKQFNELSNQNLSQAEQFGVALKNKSNELTAKEKLLLEREKSLNDMKKVIARQDSITNRLNNILRSALLGFKSDELSVEIKNGKVYVSMSEKLLFKSGSAAIEKNGLEAIKVFAGVINKNTDIDILVEGHTDNIPIKTAIYTDNWDLSVARATSIVRILTEEYKILPTRLTASGKGEFSPRASNSTPEGRASNRRTEIILSPKLDEIMKLLKKN
jgi:chemotaxis protein MotB